MFWINEDLAVFLKGYPHRKGHYRLEKVSRSDTGALLPLMFTISLLGFYRLSRGSGMYRLSMLDYGGKKNDMNKQGGMIDKINLYEAAYVGIGISIW